MNADATASIPQAAGELRPEGPPDRAELRPVLIAGPDRSGTTLMFALLASHPHLSMVRRTNVWRYFDQRYGDLADDTNLDACLGDMLRYRRMRHLRPDGARIRREFLDGEPTYGRLFALFHLHHAERAGKRRWGDKSLHTEHYAERVFAEYPEARIVHMVRDPRDRYASVRKRHGRDVPRVGASTGRWLRSTRAARRNQRRHPDRYLIVRYEDLAREPETTMRRVCAFIDEPFASSMLAMDGAPDHRDGGGNSSFGDLEPGTISTKAIGRFSSVLTGSELRFIQLVTRPESGALRYDPVEVETGAGGRVRFFAWDLPYQYMRMLSWSAWARVDLWRGSRRPPSRFADRPIDAVDEEGSRDA